jgi:hypothetical protein
LVKSARVEPLFQPPPAVMVVSNTPFGAFGVPWNIRCSNRWAQPVRFRGSRRMPTW